MTDREALTYEQARDELPELVETGAALHADRDDVRAGQSMREVAQRLGAGEVELGEQHERGRPALPGDGELALHPRRAQAVGRSGDEDDEVGVMHERVGPECTAQETEHEGGGDK